MKNQKFSHKTSHLKGKQHQLDPNLDLKQLVHHSTVQYVDRDADGDVDVYDNPKKKTPDENPIDINVGALSKKLIAKQKGELKHTKRGLAYEQKSSCGEGKYWCKTDKKCKSVPKGYHIMPNGDLMKDSEHVNEEGLRDWFGKSKSKDGKPGWVNVVTGGTCASDEPGEGTPKCVSSAKRASMTPAERRSAARRKKAADPGQQQKTGAAKPTYVSTDKPKKEMSENLSVDEGIIDILKNRKKVGTTGSGKPIYVPRKSKPSKVSYGGETQTQINQKKMQKTIDDKRKSKVKSGEYDDPWLKSSPASERRVHYQQLRGEAKEEKRYCMKCKKLETRDECSYGPEMWDKMTIKNVSEAVKDHEYSMARSQLSTVIDAAKRLKKKMGKGEGEIEAWVQSKITKAADYLDSAADYIDSGEHDVEEDCWSGYKQVGMKKKGKKMVPNCVPEETVSEEDIKEKSSGKKDACYKKVKSRYSVWPSAYASGALVKCRKVGAANWGNKSESVTIEDSTGKEYVEFIDIIKPESLKASEGIGSELVGEAVRIPAKTGNIILVTLNWRGKYYMIKMFFPQTIKPNRQEVQDQISKVYPGSRVQSYYISDIKPGEQFLQTEDWQKVNRQDKTDGMSKDAVDEYRRQYKGSKLQTAVTEKNPSGKRAERRKSFCRRMKGHKAKNTSAETARDPDSRINKALRRWNCN